MDRDDGVSKILTNDAAHGLVTVHDDPTHCLAGLRLLPAALLSLLWNVIICVDRSYFADFSCAKCASSYYGFLPRPLYVIHNII